MMHTLITIRDKAPAICKGLPLSVVVKLYHKPLAGPSDMSTYRDTPGQPCNKKGFSISHVLD